MTKNKLNEYRWVKIFMVGKTKDGKTKLKFWNKIKESDAGNIIKYIAESNKL